MTSPRIKALLIVTGSSAVALIALISLLVAWWNEPRVSSTTSTSVADLVELLPCLKNYEIRSCEFTITYFTKKSYLPAPSDSYSELIGIAIIERLPEEELVEWIDIERNEIPSELRDRIPHETNLQYAPKLSSQFGHLDCGYFWYGIIVRCSVDPPARLYILAQSEDFPNPIKLR